MPNCITGKACKLKGKGHIEYVIEKDEGLYLKITGNKKHNGNDANGKYTKEPIYLHELLHRIVAKVSSDGDTFKSKHLRKAIPGKRGKNNNNQGFVVAVLIDIGLVECTGEHGKYRLRT